LTPDALLEDFRGGAERGLKGRILLEAVIEAEGIEAEEAEYADLVARAATESGRPVDELAEQLAASGQDKALAGDILRRKALDLLAERATPVDGEGNPVDLVIPDDQEDAGNEDDTGPEPGEVDE
jgi:FKBP-type peptidyl-prolyl cis-trans isomerase (trigger factor)